MTPLIGSIDPDRAKNLDYGHVRSLLEVDQAGVYTGRYGEVSISSHFQPIFSLAHRRQVGYEALMRPRQADGTPVPPPVLLAQADSDFYSLLELDRLCRTLHIANFAGQSQSNEWLFVNIHPEVFLQAPRLGRPESLLQRLLHEHGLDPSRLVIEVVEEAVREQGDFAEAVAFFREMGCLIAVDDFGAGHSNFDRIWRLRPEIVKLDRSVIVEAGRESHIRRVLPQLVSLLHEAGTLVLIEGVETRDEANIALEADIDFVQGYFFGRPAPQLLPDNSDSTSITGIWNDFDNRAESNRQQQRERMAPYQNALGYASVLLSAGRSMEEACASFLELSNSEFCYVLDAYGLQIGTNLWAVHATPNRDPRFTPVAGGTGARWARRPYFRRAIDNFGKVQVTRPYLSISSAQLCVTLSCSFKGDGELRVLCGDVRW